MRFPIFFTAFLAVSSGFSQEFEKAEFTASSGDVLRYAILKPAEVEAGKKYPLVITLHGVGGRGAENWERNCAANAALADPAMREKFPSFVVAPTTDPGQTWFSAGKLQGKERLPDVFDLIQQLLKDLPIDPDRIYVTGQSMGGFGTFGAIVQRPDLFAAAAPVCGGHLPENAEKIARIPIWVFHGAKDKTVPPTWSREMVEAIKAAGGEPKYTEYPDVAHNAWVPAYKDEAFWAWLFDQRREK